MSCPRRQLKWAAGIHYTTLLLLLLLHLLQSLLIPTDACPPPCRCPDDETVDCSGLDLSELPPLSAGWSRSTSRLLLKKNRLQVLPTAVFSDRHLTNLEHIDLSYNNIRTIQPQAFRQLDAVRQIDLSHNQLQVIQKDAFHRVSGKASMCGTFNVRTPSCFVDLRHNELRELKTNAFAWMTNLALFIGHSDVPLVVQPYAFYGMRNVSVIRIGSVAKLHIAPPIFTNAERVGRLEIHDTTIDSISNFTFEGLTGLQTLHLSSCVIGNMQPYSFSSISYTSAEDKSYLPGNHRHSRLIGAGEFLLTNSTFDTLPTDAFRDTNLGSIVIADNTMKNISPSAFRDLSLVSLHILDNSLQTLQTDSLASLHMLKEILLHGNQISSIQPYVFRNSRTIGRLSIGRSPRVELTLLTGAFSDLSDVRTLQISNLGGLDILPNAFRDLSNVGILRIETAPIPVIRKDAFNGLHLVASLSIAYCNVTRVEPGAFGRESSAIENFDMSYGNRMQCDCDSSRVLNEFQSTFNSHTSMWCLQVLANGTYKHVPFHTVPVCRASLTSMGDLMLVMLLALWVTW